MARALSHVTELTAEHREKSKILSQLAREGPKGQEKRIGQIFEQPFFGATPTLDLAIWPTLQALEDV
jgi:hypothetical protein